MVWETSGIHAYLLCPHFGRHGSAIKAIQENLAALMRLHQGTPRKLMEPHKVPPGEGLADADSLPT